MRKGERASGEGAPRTIGRGICAWLGDCPIDSAAKLRLSAVPMSDETSPAPASDTPPDHLSVDPTSAFFDEDKLRRGVGIRFKDRVRTDIEEYCVSEGWVRVQAGKAMDRRGRPLTIKLTGPVEAWYEDLGEGAPVIRK